MRCADQSILSYQKLARRIVQPAPRVRADVVVREDLITTAQQNQVQRLAIAAGVNRDRAAVIDRIESTQMKVAVFGIQWATLVVRFRNENQRLRAMKSARILQR